MAKINVVPLDGKYEISCNGINCEVYGEEYHHLYYGKAVVIKHNGIWSLYTNSYTQFGNYPYRFVGVYKLLDNILEYKSVEGAFAYRTEDGWYFLLFANAIWYVEDAEVREQRTSNFLRLGDNLISLEKCGVIEQWGSGGDAYDKYRYGYAVTVDDNKYLVYSTLTNVFDPCKYELVKFDKYVPIRGYKNIAKVYLKPHTKKFVLAALAQDYGANYSEECTKFSKLSRNFLLLHHGKKNALYGVVEEVLEDGFAELRLYPIIPMTEDSITVHQISNQKIKISVGNSDSNWYG